LSISIRTFKGFGIDAIDGFAGSVHEFIFDERLRKIQGIVINTGIFLEPDLRIINPVTVLKLDLTERRLFVNLTKKEILYSPKVKKEQSLLPS